MREERAATLTAEAKTATRAESTKVAATREPVGSHLRLCTTPPALKVEIKFSTHTSKEWTYSLIIMKLYYAVIRRQFRITSFYIFMR